MGNRKSMVTDAICDITDFYPSTIVQIRGATTLGKVRNASHYSYSIASIKSIRLETKSLHLQMIKHSQYDELNNVSVTNCLPIYVFTARDEELLFYGYIRKYLNINRVPVEIVCLLKRFRNIYNKNHIEIITFECRSTATIPKQYVLQSCGIFRDIASIKSDILSVDLRYFEYCTGPTLLHLLDFIGYHKGKPMEQISRPIRSVAMERIVSDAWDADWVNKHDKHTLFTLIELSLSLQCNDSLQLCIAKIATLLANKGKQQVKHICIDAQHNVNWFRRIQFYIDVKTGIDEYLQFEYLQDIGFKVRY
eukprot:967007_1